MIALNAKNKLKIITNDYPEPDADSPIRALRERNNDMIISWILNTQTNCSIEMYYQKLKGLWDEIDALEASTCVLVTVFVQMVDSMGQEKPLPNATKAYAMMRQEKKQRETNTLKFTTPAVMSTFNNSRTLNNQNVVPNTKQFRSIIVLNTRRGSFKPNVICGNCQKEVHYQSECYQLVGYLVGHPLHGKVKPQGNGANNGSNRTNNFRPRTVNMVTGQSPVQDGASTSNSNSSGGQADDAVFAKMDSLQNQLNQVMMMLQNTQGQCDPKLLAVGRYLFIASCVSLFKDA
ncbi:hypothetical protein Tco_0330852 [Tanacetum coccineum]